MKRDYFYVRRGTNKDWSYENRLQDRLKLVKENNLKFFVITRHGRNNLIFGIFTEKLRLKKFIRLHNIFYKVEKKQ